MSNKLVSGRIFFKVDGQQYSVSAGITYNLGRPKRESGSDSSFEHHFKEVAQVPYISGELFDNKSLDVAKFLDLDNATITAELATGKSIVLRNAWQTGEGEVNAEEGKIPFKFEGESAEEVK
ncbi:phage tail tube protein [Aliamphritea ceti]|uniref:phage tail tube protein n=1 Tax=Aliamphritea ceti TaxID=1524258 RepID=UPI0021C2D13E|nr:phage tail tube protein [Aliamphritea ceti]